MNSHVKHFCRILKGLRISNQILIKYHIHTRNHNGLNVDKSFTNVHNNNGGSKEGFRHPPLVEQFKTKIVISGPRFVFIWYSIQNALHQKNKSLPVTFNLPFRHIDDVLHINNNNCHSYLNSIYQTQTRCRGKPQFFRTATIFAKTLTVTRVC